MAWPKISDDHFPKTKQVGNSKECSAFWGTQNVPKTKSIDLETYKQWWLATLCVVQHASALHIQYRLLDLDHDPYQRTTSYSNKINP